MRKGSEAYSGNGKLFSLAENIVARSWSGKLNSGQMTEGLKCRQRNLSEGIIQWEKS